MPGQPSVPGIPEGSVVITPAEVYAEVRELTTNVRTLLERDVADRKERATVDARADARFTDLETRVRALEQRVWVAAGFAAAVGSAVATWVTRALS